MNNGFCNRDRSAHFFFLLLYLFINIFLVLRILSKALTHPPRFSFPRWRKKKKRRIEKKGWRRFQNLPFFNSDFIFWRRYRLCFLRWLFSDIFRAFEWIRPDLKADILFLSISFFVMEPSHLKHTVKHFIRSKLNGCTLLNNKENHNVALKIQDAFVSKFWKDILSENGVIQ